jgi:hypothetical protein
LEKLKIVVANNLSLLISFVYALSLAYARSMTSKSKSKTSEKTTKIAYMIDSGFFELSKEALDYLVPKLGINRLDISSIITPKTNPAKIWRDILTFLLQECYVPRHHPDLIFAVKKYPSESVGIFTTTEDRYVIMADRDYYEERVYTPATLKWISVSTPRSPRALGIDPKEIIPKYLEYAGYGKGKEKDEQELSDFGDSDS